MREEKQRLFVAVELPEDLRHTLAGLQKNLPGIRWTSPNSLHLTVRFIGEVPPAQTTTIKTALNNVKAERFTLQINGLGSFDKKIHGVLWVGILASMELFSLKRQVDTALERHADLKMTDGRFSPHITLGRIKQADQKILRDFVAKNESIISTEFSVRSFTLFSSILAPDGAIHTIEARYDLGSI